MANSVMLKRKKSLATMAKTFGKVSKLLYFGNVNEVFRLNFRTSVYCK